MRLSEVNRETTVTLELTDKEYEMVLECVALTASSRVEEMCKHTTPTPKEHGDLYRALLGIKPEVFYNV